MHSIHAATVYLCMCLYTVMFCVLFAIKLVNLLVYIYRYDSSSNPSLSRGNSLILPRPRKSIAELEGGLESLHNAPSGWGQLPSPDSDSTDKGTEFWGIPPDDLARMTGGEQPPISNGMYCFVAIVLSTHSSI